MDKDKYTREPANRKERREKERQERRLKNKGRNFTKPKKKRK